MYYKLIAAVLLETLLEIENNLKAKLCQGLSFISKSEDVYLI